ncbi:MAG: LacI family DNA-binding transcriptional regulator [Chloroflexota bacterium]
MPGKPRTSPTMHEVADEAGVSIATVSRVINGNRPVGKDLEERVHKAMKKLHYHPSSLARSLKMNKTMLVGILVPLLEHPGYSRMASGVEKSLFERGYRGLICNSEEDETRENKYIEMLLQQRVDGIIINTSARNPAYLTELQKNNMPIVLFDRTVQGVDCHQVFCDNSLGGYSGVEYLAQTGHKRIGLIAAPAYPEVMQRRLAGAKEAMMHYQMDEDPDLIQIKDTQWFEMGYEAGTRLLQMKNPPTAIFSLTDVTAVGVMHAAIDMGIRVPDELSIVGYDDLPIASYTMPKLTTVRQPLLEMGEMAVNFLMRSIENPDAPSERAVLETRLVERQSTAPPRR